MVFQLKYLSNNPDNEGPMIGARSIGNPNILIMLPLFSIGIILKDIAIPTGPMSPPDMPCKIL